MSALLEKKCFSLKSEREKKRDENFFTSFFLSLISLSHLSDDKSTQQKSLYEYKKEDSRMRERREKREREREKKTSDFSKQKKNQQEKHKHFQNSSEKTEKKKKHHASREQGSGPSEDRVGENTGTLLYI